MSRSGYSPALFVFSLCLSVAVLPAYAVRVEEVPTPRPAGWAVDLTHTLAAGAVRELDRLGDRVKREVGAELAVVVVGSVEGRDPHAFAVDLFNRWGIGDAHKHNGVLVFAALDDRRSEIVLGSGVDGPGEQAASRAIMQGVMVPRFRAGDPAGAITGSARACAERILRLQPPGSASSGEGRATAPGAVAKGPEASAGRTPAEAPPRDAPAPRARPPARASGTTGWARTPTSSRRPGSGGGAVPWLLAGAALAVGGFGVRVGLRYRPRKCPDCGTQLVRLDELSDDAHLTAGERVEEELGSVDYDVWACRGCGQALKFRYGAWTTRYSTCPKCGAKTSSRAETTLRAASYTEGGLVEVTESCAACDYCVKTTYSTPVLQQPSSTADDSWSHDDSASSGSSWHSSGSSSPSSGSSGFGGGGTSGHGASGGW